MANAPGLLLPQKQRYFDRFVNTLRGLGFLETRSIKGRCVLIVSDNTFYAAPD
jgi:hypothetical protein